MKLARDRASCAIHISLLRLVAQACARQSSCEIPALTHKSQVGASMRALAGNALRLAFATLLRLVATAFRAQRWRATQKEKGSAQLSSRDPRAKRELQKVFQNYFLALTLDPVRENKKLNARHLACCTWSSSRIVALKLVSTSRLVVDFLRLFNCPS